ncbi:MAG: threonine ammonia-lyase [Crenarchaeota archaeon]|nr:threonine ammonia-lyase [Thermoproteota archaeon]
MFPEIANEVFSRSKEALEIVSKYAHRTPLERSNTISKMVGANVYLKLENLQKTGAFKVRGALYKVYKLHQQGVKGVVAASAGNHAQGVAYGASVFGMRAVIVMPETASIAKVEATRGYGAEVVLYGAVYDDAERKAREIAEKEGLVMVHPFNDVDIMAGQATIAWEVLEQLKEIDAVIVPIGGGGLASGILSVIKKVSPKTKVIGVEPEAAPKMLTSIKEGKPVTIEPKPSLADGLVTKRPGDLTFEIVSKLIDDIVTVSEREIAHAIYILLERCKLLAEGAGAASVAALLSGKIDAKGNVVALVTGGNIDITVLHRVLIEGMCESGRVTILRGVVPDVPGSLSRVLSVIARSRGNVLEVKHLRHSPGLDPWHAVVEIIVEVPSKDVVQRMLRDLEAMGVQFNEVG